jgi:hypothetical protein
MSGDEDYNRNWYVLIFGLDCENSPQVIAPGLAIRRLNQEITIFDLAAAGAQGFHQWSMLAPLSLACKCEIESAKDADIRPGYDALNRVWLACVLLLLKGYGKHLSVACSTYSWNEIAGHQKRTTESFKEQLAEQGVLEAVHRPKKQLPPFKGNLLDFHTHYLISKHSQKDILTKEDADWSLKHFEGFNKLAAKSERFRFALEAAVDWRFSKNPRIALARLWSGIEALFGVTSELVFRVSLLCAFLLEPPGENRHEKFQAVKKLYGVRSKAVHGDDLSEEKLYEGMGSSFELLRDLLLRVAERGAELSEDDIDRIIFY